MTLIDDKFITDVEEKNIEDFFLGPTFPWHLVKNTVAYDDNIVFDENTKDSYQFSHVMYANGSPRSEHYQNVLSLFEQFLNKHGIYYKAILRMKANLIPQTLATENQYLPAHTDAPFDHKVFIYYVNDSDGDTIFIEDGKIVESISPKQGRAILFDGDRIHANKFPILNTFRCVINIAFL